MSDACGSLLRFPNRLPLRVVPRISRPSRWARVLMICLGVFVMTGTVPSVSLGQDADAAAEFEEEAAPEAEAAADAEGDGEAGAGGEGEGDDQAAGTTKKKKDNLLAWIIKSLGWGYLIIFLGISVTLVSLFVMNMLSARREQLCPQELVDGFEEKLNAKEFQAAYDMAKTDESVLGQVLSAGLAKLSRGYNKALEGMQEVGEEESMKLEHRLSYMALIGNISPMIGLFGTVHGMINSFQVIALGGATPNPTELAGGISTALFTTLVGLAIAIPAIAAYNVLRNRVSRLLLDVGVTSENLMSRFEDFQPQGAKTK